MNRFGLVLAVSLLCAACAQAQQDVAAVNAKVAGDVTAVTGAPAPAPAAPTDPLSKLSAFTLADLQAASADAHAQTPPDQTAFQCYDFLIQVIPTIKAPGGGGTVGAVLIFQKGRDLANGISSSGGMLKSLNLACAPLVIDTQTILSKLLVLGGGAAATGGLVP